MQGWRKLGRIFDPEQGPKWVKSHAAVPCALPIGGRRVRIFFSGRDEHNRSRAGFFDAELRERACAIDIGSDPVLELGELGTFDDSGAMPSCVFERCGRIYMYYIGWNVLRTVPFSNGVGLATSDDGGRTFHRVSRGPIIPRDDVDPFFTASSWVEVEDELWRMWYLSCTGWQTEANAAPQHRYHIKYAESHDGIHWNKKGAPCIDFANSAEYAISRPSVIRENCGTYRMWYSYRGDRYRIGYAESVDGMVWNRLDPRVGIEPSSEGWDSEMIEYPCVFRLGGSLYMLYNGNGYGRSGIGLAVLEQEGGCDRS